MKNLIFTIAVMVSLAVSSSALAGDDETLCCKNGSRVVYSWDLGAHNTNQVYTNKLAKMLTDCEISNNGYVPSKAGNIDCQTGANLGEIDVSQTPFLLESASNNPYVVPAAVSKTAALDNTVNSLSAQLKQIQSKSNSGTSTSTIQGGSNTVSGSAQLKPASNVSPSNRELILKRIAAIQKIIIQLQTQLAALQSRPVAK